MAQNRSQVLIRPNVREGSITPVLSCPRLVRSPSESGRRADLSALRPRATTGHFGAFDLRLWERLVRPDGWLAVSSPLIRCRIPAESTGLWSLRGRAASNTDLPPSWPPMSPAGGRATMRQALPQVTGRRSKMLGGRDGISGPGRSATQVRWRPADERREGHDLRWQRVGHLRLGRQQRMSQLFRGRDAAKSRGERRAREGLCHEPLGLADILAAEVIRAKRCAAMRL